MSKLKAQYEKAGISQELPIASLPGEEKLKIAERAIYDSMQNSDLCIAAAGAFNVAGGPISPDHIVYSKSYPFIGQPTVERVAAFKTTHGYNAQLFAFNDAVFGVSGNAKSASLSLELAQDGALVLKLADAFGGIDYMTDQARAFIEHWEVESYRKKQLEN